MSWLAHGQGSPCPICERSDSWCVSTDDGTRTACRRVQREDAAVREDRNGTEFYLYTREGDAAAEFTPPEESWRETPASPEKRHDAYRVLLDALPLEGAHLEKLRKRGLSGDWIQRAGYSTLPDDRRREQAAAKAEAACGYLLSVPGFYKRDASKTVRLGGVQGILVPVRDVRGHIVACVIRADSPGKAGKYRWLSAPPGTTGCGSGMAAHVPLHEGEHETVRVTEGQLKADVATELSGTLTIGLPGVSAWKLALEPLRALGAKRVLIAFDADARRNKDVARALARIAEELAKQGYTVALEAWPDDAGKGIDDVWAAERGGDVEMHDGAEVWARIAEITVQAGARKVPGLDARGELGVMLGRAKKDPPLAFASEFLEAAAKLDEATPEFQGLFAEIKKLDVDSRLWKSAVAKARRAPRVVQSGDRAKPTPKDTQATILPGVFALTDDGNAQRLATHEADRARYCVPRKRWLAWDGRRWAWDETLEIVRRARAMIRQIYREAERCPDADLRAATAKHAVASEARSRIEAAVALACSLLPVRPSELDADPWALNVANGTIDLRTGELRPHRSADLITKLAPVEYKPGARSELWERYLRDATGGDAELAAYLQRAVGYALQGTVTEKAFWFLYGPPDGMKSTFLDAVSAVLGDYAVSAAAETWLVQTNTGGNRGDLVSLLGARFVASSEIRKSARFDEAMMKRVTGGDAIKAAAKFEAEIEFIPSFALWLAANDRPIARDDDTGFWSRVRVVPFTNPLPVSQRDRTMREKLRAPEVQSAILAWAVEGCLGWQRDGLPACEAVSRGTAEYREEMDRTAGFFAERCVFEEGAETSAKELRVTYSSWCEEEGVKYPVSSREFAVALEGRGCRQRRGTGGVRLWSGVRSRSASDVMTSSDVNSRKSPVRESIGNFTENESPRDTRVTGEQAGLDFSASPPEPDPYSGESTAEYQWEGTV